MKLLSVAAIHCARVTTRTITHDCSAVECGIEKRFWLSTAEDRHTVQPIGYCFNEVMLRTKSANSMTEISSPSFVATSTFCVMPQKRPAWTGWSQIFTLMSCTLWSPQKSHLWMCSWQSCSVTEARKRLTVLHNTRNIVYGFLQCSRVVNTIREPGGKHMKRQTIAQVGGIGYLRYMLNMWVCMVSKLEVPLHVVLKSVAPL